MQYCSTRNSKLRVHSAYAIRNGLSEDGGLFLPVACPALSIKDILALKEYSYPVRAAKILSLFLTDYNYDTLLSFTSRAYSSGKFPEKSPCPVVNIGDNIHVLELFHGPTAAFKDMALQMLPLLLTEAMQLEKVNEKVLILTATSGDTGSAAMTGFSEVDNTAICVFYPEGGTSLLQRLQMTTQTGSNVKAVAVKGNFDDAQRGVKDLFVDPIVISKLKDHGYQFSSANSINFGRLAPQIVYYFSAYLDMVNTGDIIPGEKIDIVVPTGNFGNILSAYYAKEMGLPVGKLICASNQNKVLFDFVRTGIYDKRRDFYRTTSPSMDILVSSNLERLLFLLLDKDDKQTSAYMHQLNTNGYYSVNDTMLKKIKSDFSAYWTDEEATISSIRFAFEKYGYLPDTHTAVALDAARQYIKETGTSSPVLVASTASPFKFPATILNALGADVPDNELEMIKALETASGQIAPDCLKGLPYKKERFTDIIEQENMNTAMDSLLG